ncbi:MAG: UvrD-helicase domain-containing protein, partial [Alphaproteobacteria bacterium]|nr:UvrD-helicase domain-containing protein [Alphaproteobacteria bacterium]
MKTTESTKPVLPILPAELNIVASLNDAQKMAVQTLQGPVLVLAGAGTGKTRVLTTRLVQIILERHAWPSQILAVTFTNKAAKEMKERVSKLIGQAADGVWLGTFHSLAVRILRRHAELINRTPSFTILDTDDQLRLIKQLIKAENLDDKRWPPRLILAEISRWKDRGLNTDKVEKHQDYEPS